MADIYYNTVRGFYLGTGESVLTASELGQIQNIDDITISYTQWSYVGLFDQGLSTSDDVIFNKLSIPNDTNGIHLGEDEDMKIYYDGTNGIIETNAITDSDLIINCGTNKTIELADTVYDDLQFSIHNGLVPAANAPTWEALTTNHNAYSFGVNDYKDLQDNELPHWWKEGTDGKIHLHLTIKTANSTGADRFAKFIVYISNENASKLWVESNYTAEVTIPDGSQTLQAFRIDLGTIDLTGLKIGTQIGGRIKRIAATGGTEYADSIFLTQVGIHLEKNTMGSRQEAIK